MPWLSTDREAIRRHLAIPASDIPLEHLDVLMNEATAASITTSQTAITSPSPLLTSHLSTSTC